MEALHAWLEKHLSNSDDVEYARTVTSARRDGLTVGDGDSMVSRLMFNAAVQSYRTLREPMVASDSPNRPDEMKGLEACRKAVIGLAVDALQR